MLGIQFTFYATISDHHDIEEWLSGLAVTYIEPPISSDGPLLTKRLRQYDDFDYSSRFYIVPDAFLNQVKFENVNGKIDIDQQNSAVIDYFRWACDVKEKRVNPSRMFAYVYCWDSEEKIVKRKDESFIREVQRIYRNIKRQLTKLESGVYAGADALKLRNQDRWKFV